MLHSDLQVEHISKSLKGRKIDVLVSGSIGAVESVRFIRSLRRLGAEVYPILSDGARRFIGADALSWASGGKEVQARFSGRHSHLASRDAMIVAPSSANMFAKIANGVTDSPGCALVASYLGEGKPVVFLPNMHDSLYNSPSIAKNIEIVSSMAVVLKPRTEEGKLKFPEPVVLADEVSHLLNRRWHKLLDSHGVMVCMGSTRGYIDDIRYISNYSSGKLGSLISEELYRYGCLTYVVAGFCQVYPKVFTYLKPCETNSEMESECLQLLKHRAGAAVCAASILDFLPSEKVEGKIKSNQHESINFTMHRTHKIIEKLEPRRKVKVGFKLETYYSADEAHSYAQTYMSNYDLSLMVLNQLRDVSLDKHTALIYPRNRDGVGDPILLKSKEEVARFVASHVYLSLSVEE
ncbi:MAG: phosphopantothenoylcysteine decarboxylase [Oligoflexales bacterium]